MESRHLNWSSHLSNKKSLSSSLSAQTAQEIYRPYRSVKRISSVCLVNLLLSPLFCFLHSLSANKHPPTSLSGKYTRCLLDTRKASFKKKTMIPTAVPYLTPVSPTRHTSYKTNAQLQTILLQSTKHPPNFHILLLHTVFVIYESPK